MTTANPSSPSAFDESGPGARLRELAAVFLKLGAISFGGPAAAIGLMEDEVVGKRRWLTRQHYLDLLGVTNLIPGPNSTEMAISVGYARAGWPGLIVAGASFILPAALLTLAIAWAYVRFGALPVTGRLLAGVKPAVIAVIAMAVWRLGRTAIRNAWLAILGAAALLAFLMKVNPLPILVGGGLLGMLLQRAGEIRKISPNAPLSAGLIFLTRWIPTPAVLSGALTNTLAVATAEPERVPLARLGWYFLKIGAVLYGGGYVLFAFVEHGLVRDHHWLTQHQVLDAIAIGQFTPGPVLSTATFIGYLLAGGWGAVVATVAIFLPSFIYVAALSPVLPKLRRSPWIAAFLDSVNVCAVALMAGVTISLAGDALRSWPMWIIAAASLAVLWKWKVNAAWVVLGGAIVGLALS